MSRKYKKTFDYIASNLFSDAHKSFSKGYNGMTGRIEGGGRFTVKGDVFKAMATCDGSNSYINEKIIKTISYVTDSAFEVRKKSSLFFWLNDALDNYHIHKDDYKR